MIGNHGRVNNACTSDSIVLGCLGGRPDNCGRLIDRILVLMRKSFFDATDTHTSGNLIHENIYNNNVI